MFDAVARRRHRRFPLPRKYESASLSPVVVCVRAPLSKGLPRGVILCACTAFSIQTVEPRMAPKALSLPRCLCSDNQHILQRVGDSLFFVFGCRGFFSPLSVFIATRLDEFFSLDANDILFRFVSCGQ